MTTLVYYIGALLIAVGLGLVEGPAPALVVLGFACVLQACAYALAHAGHGR